MELKSTNHISQRSVWVCLSLLLMTFFITNSTEIKANTNTFFSEANNQLNNNNATLNISIPLQAFQNIQELGISKGLLTINKKSISFEEAAQKYNITLQTGDKSQISPTNYQSTQVLDAQLMTANSVVVEVVNDFYETVIYPLTAEQTAKYLTDNSSNLLINIPKKSTIQIIPQVKYLNKLVLLTTATELEKEELPLMLSNLHTKKTTATPLLAPPTNPALSPSKLVKHTIQKPAQPTTTAPLKSEILAAKNPKTTASKSSKKVNSRTVTTSTTYIKSTIGKAASSLKNMSNKITGSLAGSGIDMSKIKPSKPAPAVKKRLPLPTLLTTKIAAIDIPSPLIKVEKVLPAQRMPELEANRKLLTEQLAIDEGVIIDGRFYEDGYAGYWAAKKAAKIASTLAATSPKNITITPLLNTNLIAPSTPISTFKTRPAISTYSADPVSSLPTFSTRGGTVLPTLKAAKSKASSDATPQIMYVDGIPYVNGWRVSEAEAKAVCSMSNDQRSSRYNISADTGNDAVASYRIIYRNKNNAWAGGNGVSKVALTNINESNKPCHAHYDYNWNNKKAHPYKYKLSEMPDTVVILLPKGTGTSFDMPIRGRVTSGFGPRWGRMHNGIDLDLDTGDRVKSAFKGKVRCSYYSKSYGNIVIIRHYNGIETYYAHLSKRKVSINEEVEAGQVIGLGGSTGRSTGSHLHFEMRYKGQPIDPAQFISYSRFALHGHTFYIDRKKASNQTAHSSPYRSKNTGKGYRSYSKKNNKSGGKNATYHKVSRGETLSGIARKYGKSLTQLASLNGISTRSKIRIGKRLRVK